MSSDPSKSSNDVITWVWLAAGLAAMILIAVVSIGGCRPTPPPPPPPPTTTPQDPATPTPTQPPTAQPSATPTAAPVTPPPTPAPATRPSATPTAAPIQPAATATPALIGRHTVRSGDTLWDIAGQWYAGPACPQYCGHLQWPAIWQANLDTIATPQVIYPGQDLRIPHAAHD